jgi:hypothetical protein
MVARFWKLWRWWSTDATGRRGLTIECVAMCAFRQDKSMNQNVREEFDEATPTLLEDARRLARFRSTGKGVPWAEVETWIQSWSSERDLPTPQPRVL